MEITKNDLLNLDYLKANHTRIYYFGLGFIQVVLNKYDRVHFYTNELPTTNEDVHNHRYSFKSTILKGEFTNVKYCLVEGDTHILKNESCNASIEIKNNVQIPVGIELCGMETFKKGESYYMPYNDFHAVTYNNHTITFLQRTDVITDYTQVLYKKGGKEICPFSNKVEEERLWEIINNVINK